MDTLYIYKMQLIHKNVFQKLKVQIKCQSNVHFSVLSDIFSMKDSVKGVTFEVSCMYALKLNEVSELGVLELAEAVERGRAGGYC